MLFLQIFFQYFDLKKIHSVENMYFFPLSYNEQLIITHNTAEKSLTIYAKYSFDILKTLTYYYYY